MACLQDIPNYILPSSIPVQHHRLVVASNLVLDRSLDGAPYYESLVFISSSNTLPGVRRELQAGDGCVLRGDDVVDGKCLDVVDVNSEGRTEGEVLITCRYRVL